MRNINSEKTTNNMFSKAERNYLQNNGQFSKSYSYVLEHRIKEKICQFHRLELPLMEQNPNLTEFYKKLTEKYKLRTGSEPVTFTLPM